MSGDKEKFNFYLSGDIMRRFKDMCFHKHGCGYGVIGFELEIAMNLSSKMEVAHTHKIVQRHWN